MEAILEMKNIVKTFPGVKALSGVDISLNKGEILAIVGENGAGKSTLMKVLSGVYPRAEYTGDILLEGKLAEFRNTKDSKDCGIQMIPQEVSLVLNMTVAENIGIESLPANGGIVDFKKLNEKARMLLETVGLDIDPSRKVRGLSTSQQQMISIAKALNADPKIHGILCQLPLPKHLNEESILLRIDPKKDVDAFHPYNVGRIMIGNQKFLPCTPAGVMELIRRSGIDCTGKECVVVGRSNIVGKPMAMLLLQANGTVTVCHSRTKDLSEVTRRADILVVAIGKADFVTGNMVKEGAVVIDVGMNRKADGKLTGDVDFATVAPKASYITPVPGGVGPMTITMLMQNTLTAATDAARS